MRRRRATSGGLGWAQGTRGMEPPRLAPVEQALGGGFVAELGVLSYDKAAMECHGLGGLGYSVCTRDEGPPLVAALARHACGGAPAWINY